MRDDDERLRQAVRVGNIGIFDHDHEADLIYWSPELRDMYGWHADEPATLPKILSHVHPDELERVVAAVAKSHDPDGDGAFDLEHRIVDRAGRLRWLLMRSRTHFGPPEARRPIRTIGAVQDVTERRTAEDSARVLDTVLSSSVQAIAIADSHGTLTFANAALRRLWGYSDGEVLLGRSLFDLLKAAEVPAAALSEIKDHRLQYFEMPATRVDGSRFYLRVTVEASSDANGVRPQVLVTCLDITDRKRLESQLLQAQKMESVGRLAGGIAHDFNNLLTVISGGLHLSMASLSPDHPSRVYLTDVTEAAQSAAALTRRLLAFSRKELIAPKVLDLNEVLLRAEKMIVRLIGEDVHLRTVSGTDLAPICFDPGQVEQILINLAVNARDAMPNGGQLTIETSNVWLDEEYAARHVDVRPGAYVRLSVSDDGVGMTDEVRAHLFEPFFTTKEAGKGTGLGLAMVYGAVQQNGGRIEVHSELGHGTTFDIYLPAATGSPQRPSLRSPVAVEKRNATILLVEDDARVRLLAKNVLSSQGYDIHAFGGGNEALRALSSLTPAPNLLITDVIMPGINGLVLAERITEALPEIRVLFVSGYTQNVVLDRGTLKNGIEFLAKPYSIEKLTLRVREILHGVDA